MFDLDKWQEIIQTIAKNPVRTFATAFGVFWGILMLILLLGAGQGLQNGVRQSMLLDAINSIWVIPSKTSMSYQGNPAGREHPFNEEDLTSVEQNISGIDMLSPENFLESNYQVKYQNRSAAFGVYGVYSDYFEIKVSQKVVSGRGLNPIDDQEKRKVCYVGDRVVESLFQVDQDPVGEYLNINDVSFKIVGVFKFESNAGMDQSQRIYIPFTTFQSIFNPNRKVNLFVVTTASGVSGAVLEEDMMAHVKKLQGVHPEDNRAYWVHNQQEDYEMVGQLFFGIKAFIWLVGIGTLMAGIVGVSNIMIIVVKERTREIGIRKAVGAKPGSIIGMIVQESIFITAVAGYLGLLLGVILLESVNQIMMTMGVESDFFKNPEINFEAAISALVVLVIAGAIAGLFPAMKAAKIKPIDALNAK